MGKKIKNSTKNSGRASEKTNAKSSQSRGRAQELSTFALGASSTEYPSNYAPEVLEVFDNKNPKSTAWTTLVCTEFTSLCPKTGQPDFAKVFINYIGDKKMVESKSLKLYLFSFRNHGDFHEDCIQTICDDLYKIMKPKYIEVIGEFTPRGGIAIFPFCSRANDEKFSQEIYEERLLGYSPGAYSMELSRLY